MRIKRIDPISAAKVGGVLYAGLGLVIGAFVSLVIMAIGGAAAFSDEGSRAAPFLGMLFGAGSIVILPVFYGVLGAIMMLITALLYNLAARITGGIQIDVQQ